MREHSIRLWSKFDGTFDVTHHKATEKDEYMYDVDVDFKNFQDMKDAVDYMFKLKAKFESNGGIITDFGFESFGYQCEKGGWSSVPQNPSQPIRDTVKGLIQEAQGRLKA